MLPTTNHKPLTTHLGDCLETGDHGLGRDRGDEVVVVDRTERAEGLRVGHAVGGHLGGRRGSRVGWWRQQRLWKLVN